MNIPEIKEILKEIEQSSFVYRKFLNKDEVKLCNQMVKDEMLYKSTPDEKNATIAFFITEKGRNFIK